MPRHLIGDAHEWVIQSFSVSPLYPPKSLSGETGLKKKVGKEDPVEFGSKRD